MPTAASATGGGVQLGNEPITNGAVTPFAIVNPPEGGTWTYGTESCWKGKGAYSKYIHRNKYHWATAVVGGDWQTDYAYAGFWAEAHACGYPWDDSAAYYGVQVLKGALSNDTRG